MGGSASSFHRIVPVEGMILLQAVTVFLEVEEVKEVETSSPTL